MIFETKPNKKWKVTALDSKGKTVNLGFFSSDNHLAESWDGLNRTYSELKVEDVSKRKAT